MRASTQILQIPLRDAVDVELEPSGQEDAGRGDNSAEIARENE